ncbi:Endothelial cell scavenger receptor [Pteropus alecto]|uniref:Endothelial cell scavenger receptor n=1 Tax=Pteropus alecto TaxID=9402 RepID=L5JTY2_PTEAL|nr:Endothelial cell scavenger receptor [Pteropus alecto]
MVPWLLLPLLLLWIQETQGSELKPNGRHVCKANSPSAELQCCPGWRQKDQECTIPVATASGMNHALQTQAAVSPVSQAGTEPSVTSPVHLEPLAKAAGSSAPAAGLERPVSQILGTVRAVTLAGWGPGSHSQDAALIAGILVPLLLLLLGIACCACCCWANRLDPKDRPAKDGTAVSRVKLQVWGALTSLGSALPCSSLSSHKLPWVTVSHHDPEIPFNHSFIEPPSAGWASDDSFSSDSESGEEDEGPTYCVPPQEGMVPIAQPESPEASLAGGTFPPPEDASTPFVIPRTSSLARAKRPSVSFAEGTKFAPQSRRSSGELSSPLRKPKRLSRGAQPGPENQEAEESIGPEQVERDKAPPGAASPRDSAIGHRRLPLGGRTVAERVEAIEGSIQESSGSVTTIYMLAGTPRESDGPVRSVLRRFGSFQKGQAEPKVKSAIPKPPRRALSRNKGSPGLASGSASQSPGSAPNEGLTGASESVGSRPEEVARGLGDGMESSGRTQEPDPQSGPPEQDPQKVADEEGQEEPQYENVTPISGPPEP